MIAKATSRRRTLSVSVSLLGLLALSGGVRADVVGEAVVPAEFASPDPHAIYGFERPTPGSGECGKEPDLSYAIVPLCTGDRIEIKEPSGYLDIRYNGSQKLDRIDQFLSPYEIRVQTASPSPIDFLFGQLTSLVGSFETPPTEEHIMLMSRTAVDGKLAVPILDSNSCPSEENDARSSSADPSCEGALLEAGNRPLSLVWSGGKPPFTVTITTADGTEVETWEALEERLLQTAPFELPPGRHVLTLSDGATPALSQSFAFTAVAPSRTPAPDTRLTLRDGDNPALVETLQAMWLAGMNEAWMWEGFVRVMPYANAYPPAAALASKLGRGQTPGR